MIDSIKEDIITVLKSIEDTLRERNFIKLKDISNHTIHSASIFQDEDSTSVAVITYALSKIIESCDNEVQEKIKSEIHRVRKELLNDNLEGYKAGIKNIFKIISNVNQKLKQYIEEVVQYAEIKKGARIYEHGISMARASELLGISEWELMNYVGRTTLIDSEEPDEKERLSFARKLFGIKK